MEVSEYRRVYANVDLDAIEENIRQMELQLPEPVPMLAVIKTNGYGHGAIAIARELEQNTAICGYAVATAEEALELRRAGMKKMILILGYVFEKDFEALIREEIRFTVFRYDMAQSIAAVAEQLHKKAYVHIKIDTGMHRIGYAVHRQSVEEIIRISRLDDLELEGIFTHFARADETDKSHTAEQYARFDQMIGWLGDEGMHFALRHCCNSASILELGEYHMDMVRAGITLYGLWPSDEVDHQFSLCPALSLYSHIVHIKELSAGEAIGYGGTYVTSKTQKIATIPVGYGDGYPRSLSNQGDVLIRGKRAPIVGRVCMDQFMVDVTHIPDVACMDRVTLIGRDGKEEITMEELGDRSGRFNYELACDLGIRIPRDYYKNGTCIDEMNYFA